jgi:hypothetical protein
VPEEELGRAKSSYPHLEGLGEEGKLSGRPRLSRRGRLLSGSLPTKSIERKRPVTEDSLKIPRQICERCGDRPRSPLLARSGATGGQHKAPQQPKTRQPQSTRYSAMSRGSRSSRKRPEPLDRDGKEGVAGSSPALGFTQYACLVPSLLPCDPRLVTRRVACWNVFGNLRGN